MSVCIRCGTALPGGELCPNHYFELSDDWGRSNKILCDLLHRRIKPARVEVGLRDDEWALSA